MLVKGLIVRHAAGITLPAPYASSHSDGCSSTLPQYADVNSACDSLQDHVIMLDLCGQGRASVMKSGGGKSILMTHGLYVFAG